VSELLGRGDSRSARAESRVSAIRQHWPLVVALIALATVGSALYIATILLTEGHLVYTLDDAYIHMAMAKNLVRHGVWGMTPFGFTSSSSSPLWLIMLAGVYWIVGTNDWAPLVMNGAAAALLLLVTYMICRRSGVGPIMTSLLLLAELLLVPVVPVAFCGLEHLLRASAWPSSTSPPRCSPRPLALDQARRCAHSLRSSAWRRW
jgi:hypothetical protein